MIDDILGEAPLHALGLLEGAAKVHFEDQLVSSEQVRRAAAEYAELIALLPLGFQLPADPKPSGRLKDRILSKVGQSGAVVTPPESPKAVGVVFADRSGRIAWVNEAFTKMCGHTLQDLIGRKPGEMLQGQMTDPADADCLRQAVRQRLACTRSIINYHKDGSPYRVNIQLIPLVNGDREFQGYIALENLLEEESLKVA